MAFNCFVIFKNLLSLPKTFFYFFPKLEREKYVHGQGKKKSTLTTYIIDRITQAKKKGLCHSNKYE